MRKVHQWYSMFSVENTVCNIPLETFPLVPSAKSYATTFWNDNQSLKFLVLIYFWVLRETVCQFGNKSNDCKSRDMTYDQELWQSWSSGDHLYEGWTLIKKDNFFIYLQLVLCFSSFGLLLITDYYNNCSVLMWFSCCIAYA